MEKDKLSILDVCGAYGQKDIKKLNRSEMNKPHMLLESAERMNEKQLKFLGLTILTLKCRYSDKQTTKLA